MKDYICEMAEKLRNNEAVIFYTVGSVTFEQIKEMKHRYGILPTAVCDGDKRKQGKTYKGLEGLFVISPEDAMKKYPDGNFFVTSLDYKYEIFGYLVEKCGISTDRIINYVPVKKVKSCFFLQKALIYDRTGELCFCWRNPAPRVPEKEKIEVGQLKKLRNALIESIQKGEPPAHEACVDCPQIMEAYYPIEPRAWSLNYFCQSVCNYKCSYCTVAHSPKLEHDMGRHTLGELISEFVKEDLLSEEYNVILSTAGEPALHPKRKEFYESFQGTELVYNTNASLYDQDLADMMQKKNVLVISSVDAGTSETYAKIKGVAAFDKIKKNLSAYSKMPQGIVALKYIFLPGVNDTIENVDGFVQLCVDVGATFAIIALDVYGLDKITEQTKKMVHRMRKSLADKDILCVPYTAWETVEYKSVITKLMEE